MSANHLVELAQDIVNRAQAAGASDAECTISEGEEFSANVRMREVENLKEAGCWILSVQKELLRAEKCK